MDLDQAMFVQRRDGGSRVYYAIADIAATPISPSRLANWCPTTDRASV